MNWKFLLHNTKLYHTHN